MPLAPLTLLAALLLDQCLGDPVYACHPVRLIGRLIAPLETGLRRVRLGNTCGGVLLAVLVPVFSLGAYLALRRAAGLVHEVAATAVDVFVLYSCLALRDLLVHARPVNDALTAGDIAAARAALRRIVGRDVTRLDASGVARAAVESVSESFVDSLFAPLFWFCAGTGVALATGWPPATSAVGSVLVYRCINTLDSMVGYRNERYARFGWASARLDDVLNFLPARLSLAPLFLAAWLCRFDARGGWRVAMRDRLKHASPNSAHAESFAAGALGVRLGGPTVYPGRTVEKPWLGSEGRVAGHEDIAGACRLVRCAGWISAAICASLVSVMTLGCTHEVGRSSGPSSGRKEAEVRAYGAERSHPLLVAAPLSSGRPGGPSYGKT